MNKKEKTSHLDNSKDTSAVPQVLVSGGPSLRSGRAPTAFAVGARLHYKPIFLVC